MAAKPKTPLVRKARSIINADGGEYRAFLQKDKLKLDDRSYSVNDLSELPHSLQPQSVFTPMNKEVVLFFTKNSPFSNHHKANFTIDGVTYNCSEQYIMRRKCIWTKDYETAEKIMKEDDPVIQKSLGKQVKIFNRVAWEKEAKALIKDGIRAKIVQNPYIKELLSSTDHRKIAEANKYDRFFAIGYHLNDVKAWDVNNWSRGQNILGIYQKNLGKNCIQEAYKHKTVTISLTQTIGV